MICDIEEKTHQRCLQTMVRSANAEFIELFNCLCFISGSLCLVNRGIHRFSGVSGLTWLRKAWKESTTSITLVCYGDKGIFWGQMSSTRVDRVNYFSFSLCHPLARPKMMHPDKTASMSVCWQPAHRSSPNSLSLYSLLSLASSTSGFTDNMQALVTTGIKFTPQSLPLRLPLPQPSTFCNTNLADNEDNKKREQLSPGRAGETDKSSKVTQSLPYHSLPVVMDATASSNEHQANLSGIITNTR